MENLSKQLLLLRNPFGGMDVAKLLTDNFIKNQETPPARNDERCLGFGFASIMKLFNSYHESHYLQGYL